MTVYYERGNALDVNGISMHVIDEGAGPCVLMLHGFPDSARLWRNQIGPLLEAGYRVVAPDLRGFGQSDAPEGVEAYSMLNIMEDLRQLLEKLEIEKAHFVGHDFGGGTSWVTSSFFPQLARSLTVVSVGHPASFNKPRIDQLEKSWYMLLFQFEGVAEEFISRDNFAFFKQWAPEDLDIERYTEDLSRPGRLTAALNWYRANLPPTRLIDGGLDWPQLDIPVMGVWSDRDMALLEEQMTESNEFVRGPWRYERIEGVGHWIPLHAADRLNELLLDFLGSVDD